MSRLKNDRDSACVPPITSPMSTASPKNSSGCSGGRKNPTATTPIQANTPARISRQGAVPLRQPARTAAPRPTATNCTSRMVAMSVVVSRPSSRSPYTAAVPMTVWMPSL